MADPACDILFLVDRIAGRENSQALVGLASRLEAFGHCSRFFCRSASIDHGLLDLTEHPGLGRRWQRPWAIRGLDLSFGENRPRILQILSTSMAEVGLAIAERWRIPYLLGVDEFPGKVARLRLSRHWCRGLVATNRELALALVRDFGIPRQAIHEILPGVSEPIRPRIPSKMGRVPVIGAAGPLVGGSGFATFLNAARKVVDAGMDAEFLIAGEGEDEGELRRRAERLRIAERLTFADEIPVGLSFWDVLDVYCQTSVVPTVGRRLTLAMAAGVASIASDVEGLRSLVKDEENGLMVPEGDSASLAQAIIRLLQDREKAATLGEAGRNTVLQDHHPDLEAEQYHGLFTRIVESGLGPQDSGLASRTVAFETVSGLDSGRGTAGLGFTVAPSWFGPRGD
jgi:glycosyltransferase involved in cell wall biosynthesis